jgi:hypothetical protein
MEFDTENLLRDFRGNQMCSFLKCTEEITATFPVFNN